MKTASQIIVYVATLLGALFVGSFYNTAFWQAGFHAKHLLGGKPLPTATQFLIENHGLAFYLCVLPWLWLVGAPWLTRHSSRNYWNDSAFILRCLAFLAGEGLLLLLLNFFLFLPYIAYYGVLRSTDVGTPETVGRFVFWSCVAGVLILGTWRWYQRERVPC